MGKYGFGTRLFTRKLLKSRKVHFVATDAHDTGRRAPLLSECREYVERKIDSAYADDIFYNNPLAVIKGEII